VRIDASLSLSPYFEQVRLQSFELAAQKFLTFFDVFRGAVLILQQESQRSSSIQRHQSLNDVIAIDHGFVIGSRELKDSFDP